MARPFVFVAAELVRQKNTLLSVRDSEILLLGRETGLSPGDGKGRGPVTGWRLSPALLRELCGGSPPPREDNLPALPQPSGAAHPGIGGHLWMRSGFSPPRTRYAGVFWMKTIS